MKKIISALFNNLTDDEILSSITCSGAKTRTFKKNEIVFDLDTRPDKLYLLLSGMIGLCMDSISGDKSILNVIEEEGDIFGEVYLFIEEQKYDYYALVLKDSEILEIPKTFFYQNCEKCCTHHSKLINNMLGILAIKAHSLTKKNQILSSSSIRQKIAKYLFMSISKSGEVELNMNREDLANYLNVTRPSLSRELANMSNDNLIDVKGKHIKVIDNSKLEEYI